MTTVRFEARDAVGLITLDRPPVNAINTEVVADLAAAITAADDPAVRAVVITGSPHFAAGADIKGFQASFDSGDEKLASGLSAAVRRLEQLSKPVIAAVFGYALGGGLELAMGADLIYMAADAQVGQPEITLGIMPGAGGTQRLPRLVGVARAKELIYTGRMVDAAEAHSIGIATKVETADALLGVAMADAAELASGPTVALAAAKKAITEGTLRSMDDGLAMETAGFNEAFGTADAREGVAAFIEKRAPEFEGR
ncbi:MAG: enoyl-CoA hydratase-related protein [Acidimicrobiia bacterium]